MVDSTRGDRQGQPPRWWCWNKRYKKHSKRKRRYEVRESRHNFPPLPPHARNFGHANGEEGSENLRVTSARVG